MFDKYPEIRPALGAAFNLNGGAAVLDRLGLTSAFRELENPMRRVRSRRVAADRTQLMVRGRRCPSVVKKRTEAKGCAPSRTREATRA